MKKSQNSFAESPEKDKDFDSVDSPEKKRVRPNFLEDSSDEDIDILPRTKISQDDPLLSSYKVQDQVISGVSDKEWEEMIEKSRKKHPEMKPMTPSSPARRRRQKHQNQAEGRRLFNAGEYKTTPSPKKLDHEKFDQLLKGIYFKLP